MLLLLIINNLMDGNLFYHRLGAEALNSALLLLQDLLVISFLDEYLGRLLLHSFLLWLLGGWNGRV